MNEPTPDNGWASRMRDWEASPDHEAPAGPSPDLWGRIEADLPPPARRRGGFWWWFGIPLLLCLVTSGYLLLPVANVGDVSPVASRSVPSTSAPATSPIDSAHKPTPALAKNSLEIAIDVVRDNQLPNSIAIAGNRLLDTHLKFSKNKITESNSIIIDNQHAIASMNIGEPTEGRTSRKKSAQPAIAPLKTIIPTAISELRDEFILATSKSATASFSDGKPPIRFSLTAGPLYQDWRRAGSLPEITRPALDLNHPNGPGGYLTANIQRGRFSLSAGLELAQLRGGSTARNTILAEDITSTTTTSNEMESSFDLELRTADATVMSAPVSLRWDATGARRLQSIDLTLKRSVDIQLYSLPILFSYQQPITWLPNLSVVAGAGLNHTWLKHQSELRTTEAVFNIDTRRQGVISRTRMPNELLDERSYNLQYWSYTGRLGLRYGQPNSRWTGEITTTWSHSIGDWRDGRADGVWLQSRTFQAGLRYRF